MKNFNLVLGLLLSILCLSTSIVNAQNTFRYQAVARDSTGAVLADQLIGVQIGIIQVESSLPPIYQEAHQVTTNSYGVLNLNVGDGMPLIGDFTNIDWSQESFMKVEIDVTGGSNYDLTSLSEILSVPRALYAERAGSIEGGGRGLYVTDFGALGDGTTDDTDAFEMALDSAQIIGGKLFVPHGIYKITRSLIIGDGVSLIGEGSGSDPLQTPYNGSLLWYDGDDYAIKVKGHSSRLKDLVIRDKSDGNALGGVLLEADGRLVESVYFFEVLISGFIAGTGLKLYAQNSGGIAYASFNNVRVRHGKIGIHIDQTNNSFVNSNTWNHCQISGGGFDYGMLIDGGNNNILNGVVIEPLSTTNGHLLVNAGEIYASEMRIEGVNQGEEVPLIMFDRRTKNSTLNGVYAGGLTLDKGNNFINMRSGKAIHYKNSSFNKFKNATFFTPDGTTIPDWDISGNGVSIEVLDPELSDVHNILKVTIPAGSNFGVEPSPLSRPAVKELPLYDQVNFGFYMKIDQPATAFAVTNAPQGWARSIAHSGSDEWEFVGMNAEVSRNSPARFMVQINNNSGSEIIAYITTPTLSFGMQLPTLDEAPLFTSGGELTGQLTHAYATSTTPNNGYLKLPLSANYYEITNSFRINRINHLTADRVPRGTVITLLFNHDGVEVSNSGYLKLKANFSSLANGSLTLLSNGDGTWREVNRNN